MDGIAGQNHIFVLIKGPGGKRKKKYQVLQGYIGGARSPGYNLTTWLRSDNLLAEAVDETYLTHTLFKYLKNFIDNAGAHDGKVFDGKTFAKAFHADSAEIEPHFNGRPYVGLFRWREVEDSDMEGMNSRRTLAEKLAAKANIPDSFAEVDSIGSIRHVDP